jgi:hypothetical protein
MTDPYSTFAPDAGTRHDAVPPPPSSGARSAVVPSWRRGRLRPALWALLVVALVVNGIASVASLHLAVNLATGLVALAIIITLIILRSAEDLP